ncbi:hypothetical protein GCM10020256_12550 [Streptomyces thermocoprophilus]
MVTAWAAASGVGLAVGPVIAGTLLNHFHWHTVFLSTAALAVLTMAVAAFVPESRAPGGKLDVPGQILAVLGIAALVYALIEGGHDGYTSGRIVTAWVVAAAALAGFVFVERAAARPMLDMRLFRSASFSAVMFVAAVSLFGFTGVSILSVLFYQRVQHLSALDVGWRLLALFGVYVVVAWATGRIIRRTGFKLPLTLGFLIGAGATAGFLTLGPDTPYSHVWWLYVLFGAACGMVAAPSTAAALVSVSHEHAGMASGAVNAFRQVGSVTGSSLVGALLAHRLQSELPGRAGGPPRAPRVLAGDRARRVHRRRPRRGPALRDGRRRGRLHLRCARGHDGDRRGVRVRGGGLRPAGAQPTAQRADGRRHEPVRGRHRALNPRHRSGGRTASSPAPP